MHFNEPRCPILFSSGVSSLGRTRRGRGEGQERKEGEGKAAGDGGGGGDGGRGRRRGEPEPEMAARWLLLLLALLAAHAAALPDFIRIGEYLSPASPGVKAAALSTALNSVSKIIINVPLDNICEGEDGGGPTTWLAPRADIENEASGTL